MDVSGFGAKLKELREAAGLSQRQLADKSGVSQKSVSAYEQSQREPLLSAIGALAEALDVDVKVFFEPAAPREPAGRGRPVKPVVEAVPEPKRPRGRPRKDV